jgi:WD40 repeat protein
MPDTCIRLKGEWHPFAQTGGHDAHAGTCVRSQEGHVEGIQDIALSPDGSQAITGSDDNTVRVFDFDVEI